MCLSSAPKKNWQGFPGHLDKPVRSTLARSFGGLVDMYNRSRMMSVDFASIVVVMNS